jgi:hypothetical protein
MMKSKFMRSTEPSTTHLGDEKEKIHLGDKGVDCRKPSIWI